MKNELHSAGMNMPESQRHLLSKSTFMMGMQCPKRLWFYKKRPDLRPPISPAQQLLFSKGTDTGLLAQQLFPGGKDASPADYFSYPAAIRQTFDWITAGETIIYEAAFQFNRVMAALDILVKDKTGWKAFEVKSSTEIKEQHIQDAALQYYVITNAGLPLQDISIIHLNNQYTRQGALNLQELFTISSVLQEVLELQEQVQEQVELNKKILLLQEEPKRSIGPHCSSPYDCEFSAHCWNHIPEVSVFSLGRLNTARKFELYEKGIIRLQDLPEDVHLSAAQHLQVHAYLDSYIHVDEDNIRAWLQQMQYPLVHMDFETFMPAVPLYDHSRPYQQIPFQFSVHVQETPGAAASHQAFLGDPTGDPREAFLQQLLEATKGSGTVLVYNQAFECTRLRELKEQFPDYAESIDALTSRIVDLMVPFQQKWYYHPQMNGSYSIKFVLPAMVPELGYDSLAIGDGGTAMAAFEGLLHLEDPAEKEKIRQALLEYCALDTMAMVKILEKLMQLAAA